ncbi:unnamed protein product [Peniophora sp. CBMAI 1063]|nr:unnamed protein product [Peniophora sp. CBMAI 1063]
MTGPSPYEPLAGHESGVDFDGSNKEQPGLSERRSWRLIYWAFAASILCMAGNISIMSLKSRTGATAKTDALQLQFASTYMGLDRALLHSTASSSLPDIVNFPLAFGVVDSASPNKVSIETSHRVTSFGTHFPEDRIVSLSVTATTFVQFWAGDFGMERCTLELALRAPDASDGALQLSDLPLRVEVYTLQEPRVMGLHDLSYNARPRRAGIFTTWDVRDLNMTHESPEFACSSGTIHTFELACGGQDCSLRLTQSPTRKDFGVWLIQHSSL